MRRSYQLGGLVLSRRIATGTLVEEDAMRQWVSLAGSALNDGDSEDDFVAHASRESKDIARRAYREKRRQLSQR